ncbi:MAG: TonB-dependent receptor [Bacteroidales bacterium]|nr:TonB-dependent receptor [Bacteroidales bacterium]
MTMKKLLWCLIAIFVASDIVVAQDATKVITGSVTDSQGQPVPGASVIAENGKQGTITDADGNYSIAVPEKTTLLISCLGYNDQKIRVWHYRNEYHVVLNEDTATLRGVVVVGYGAARKSDLTGSITSVNSETFANQPVRKISDVLQGRSAGVEVTNTSGMAGASAKIRVRGTTSINKSSDPLYVVDGIISTSGLDGINPQDIESLQVLKDASSTAIYGSRGANGVILVTTLSGKEGKAAITFDAKTGLSQVRKDYNLLTPYEYALALNDIRGAGTISDADLAAYKNGTKGIDWIDLMTRNAISQDYNLSISGGNGSVRYLISGNALDQQAVTINAKYQRFGLRTNIDADVRKWLTISAKLNASMAHNKNGAPNWSHILNLSPTMELKDPETGIYNNDPYNMGAGSNAYGAIMENKSDSYAYNLNGNLSLLFTITKGLTLSVQGGVDYAHTPSYSFTSSKVAPGNTSSMSNSSNMYRYWQNTNNLSYSGTFNGHTVSANAVWEMSGTYDTALSISGRNLSNESVGYWNVNNAATRSESNSYSSSTLASGIARISYDYGKRYFITAAFRADGSSKFQGKNKWGFFPSAAVAWDIAAEDFMKGQNVVSQLKLRASYGVSGNEAISAYSTMGMLSETIYGWGSTSGYTGYWGNTFATPGLTWEKTTQYDVGMDMNIGGVEISVDWFRKDTEDLLFQKQVPGYNGGGTYWVNQGELLNTGVELSVNAFPLKSSVVWEMGFNAAYIHNEVVDLAGNEFILQANYSDLGGAMQIMKPNYPLGSFNVYRWKGFDEKGANLYLKKDGTLTTSPTSDDLVIKGNASPKWTLGWNNTLTWRHWTLNVFFNAALDFDRLNISRYTTASMSGGSRFITLRDAYFKGWDYVEDKSKAEYPNVKNSENKVLTNSDFWLEDASFLKLKNISLSYYIPRRVTKFAGIRLTLSAQDLFTFTGYSGMDPEVYSGYDGLDYGAYPIPRTYTFSVQFRF